MQPRRVLNKKAGYEASLSWVRDIILFIAITFAGYFIIAGIAAGDIKANNASRGLGAVFDVLPLSNENVEIVTDCPSGVIFTISSDKITAKASSFMGVGEAYYYYMKESDVTVMSNSQIDCSTGRYIKITKDVSNPSKKQITVQEYAE